MPHAPMSPFARHRSRERERRERLERNRREAYIDVMRPFREDEERRELEEEDRHG